MKTLLFFLIYTLALLFICRFVAVCTRYDHEEKEDDHGNET